MPFLSVVIPAYKSQKTLPALLKSIAREKVKEMEVIVVEDGGGEKSQKFFNDSRYKNYRFFQLDKNRGPAFARNFGAEKAKGKVILFLDADVVVQPGTIKEVVKTFTEDKYRVAATGVWDKKQKSNKFFPKFKALRDWSYWINEKKADSYYYLFSTRIAAIRKDVFVSLNGFNEKFQGADVEDIEFTYRLAQKYRIDFNPKMHVLHEFEGFWPIAKKYFRRAYQWVEIYESRKKFDPVATTGNEAMTAVSAVGMTVGFIIFLIFNSQLILLTLPLLFLIVHLVGVGKFLKFTAGEEGIGFAVKSFFVGIVLYHFIFAGALWGMIKARLKNILFYSQ